MPSHIVMVRSGTCTAPLARSYTVPNIMGFDFPDLMSVFIFIQAFIIPHLYSISASPSNSLVESAGFFTLITWIYTVSFFMVIVYPFDLATFLA